MNDPIQLRQERGRGEVPTCPTCGHAMREGKRLTARELDVHHATPGLHQTDCIQCRKKKDAA